MSGATQICYSCSLPLPHALESPAPWLVPPSSIYRDLLGLNLLCACAFLMGHRDTSSGHASCNGPNVTLKTLWEWPSVTLGTFPCSEEKCWEQEKYRKQIYRLPEFEAKYQNYSNTTMNLGMTRTIFWLWILLQKSIQQKGNNRSFLIPDKEEYWRGINIRSPN